MKQASGLSSTLSKAMILALLYLAAGPSDSVLAKIYKYKDDQGKTHFTDDPGKIPLRYRDQGSVKRFRGVPEPAPEPGVPPGFPGASSSEEEGGAKDSSKEDEGFTAQEEALVKKTIAVFQAGVALGERYKNAFPNFSNGQGAVIAIQEALPRKEQLANQLEGTKVPELLKALGFLKQSIAADRQTESIGQGLKKRIAGIFDRLASESRQQANMIKLLNLALIESQKKKAEAAKKKLKESKKANKK